MWLLHSNPFLKEIKFNTFVTMLKKFTSPHNINSTFNLITMKKIIFLFTISTFLFAGCSGNQTKEQDHNDKTHEHHEGEVHQHSDGEDTLHEHNHNDGHKH